MYGDFAADLMVQVVALQVIFWYTLLIFLFELLGARMLIMEQYLESGWIIVSIKVDSYVVSLDRQDVLETSADIRDDGKLHVTVIYIAPLKAIVQERMNDWKNGLVSKLGKKIVEMTGNYTPNLMALMSADIIISTPEKWDGISRKWHIRSYVTKVGLMILDEIYLLGTNRGPILEGMTQL
uniref:DExH-box ATP-dependent RNA helicase DExH14 n=1 Tax=Tanacetum cinerariifolium TaxID=118510 RepID=A0A699K8L5_TANCI|nr:DExH-box ATP-dependent RNA helicase DExH14 [Tanacetum cinerariifolium]